MLETYHLKKQLETTRQELSHALYQSDAACRVIARTIKERDAARRELEQLRIAVGRGGVTKMEVESQLPGLDSETRTKMTTKSVELSAMRKQKVCPIFLLFSILCKPRKKVFGGKPASKTRNLTRA